MKNITLAVLIAVISLPVTVYADDYKIRVISESPLKISVLATYYDEKNKAITKTFYGDTPYRATFPTEKGVNVIVRPVITMKPSSPNYEKEIVKQYSAILFKGNSYIDADSTMIENDGIELHHGSYPDDEIQYTILK